MHSVAGPLYATSHWPAARTPGNRTTEEITHDYITDRIRRQTDMKHIHLLPSRMYFCSRLNYFSPRNRISLCLTPAPRCVAVCGTLTDCVGSCFDSTCETANAGSVYTTALKANVFWLCNIRFGCFFEYSNNTIKWIQVNFQQRGSNSHCCMELTFLVYLNICYRAVTTPPHEHTHLINRKKTQRDESESSSATGCQSDGERWERTKTERGAVRDNRQRKTDSVPWMMVLNETTNEVIIKNIMMSPGQLILMRWRSSLHYLIRLEIRLNIFTVSVFILNLWSKMCFVT